MGINDFINNLVSKLPALCTSKDLIVLGIFTSENQAYHARKSGKSPDYFELPNGKIRYPKEAVIEFLEKSKRILNKL
jgi:hypothetical protein